MVRYKITKLKKNLRLLTPLNAKPYRLLTPEQVAEINKKLNSPIRKAQKRRHYLESKQVQEKLNMASSYLVLINNVLRDLNEVELTSSTFSSSRGIQTAVKDYVNRAIDDIINADTEWPFTVAQATFTTTTGTRLYTRSEIGVTDTKTIDYDSFTFLEAADKSEKN